MADRPNQSFPFPSVDDNSNASNNFSSQEPGYQQLLAPNEAAHPYQTDYSTNDPTFDAPHGSFTQAQSQRNIQSQHRQSLLHHGQQFYVGAHKTQQSPQQMNFLARQFYPGIHPQQPPQHSNFEDQYFCPNGQPYQRSPNLYQQDVPFASAPVRQQALDPYHNIGAVRPQLAPHPPAYVQRSVGTSGSTGSWSFMNDTGSMVESANYISPPRHQNHTRRVDTRSLDSYQSQDRAGNAQPDDHLQAPQHPATASSQVAEKSKKFARTCYRCEPSRKGGQKYCRSASEWKKHQDTHDKPNKCPHCDKEEWRFATTSDLNRHIIDKHPNVIPTTKHKCPHCQHATTRLYNMKPHVRSRHNVKGKDWEDLKERLKQVGSAANDGRTENTDSQRQEFLTPASGYSDNMDTHMGASNMAVIAAGGWVPASQNNNAQLSASQELELDDFHDGMVDFRHTLAGNTSIDPDPLSGSIDSVMTGLNNLQPPTMDFSQPCSQAASMPALSNTGPQSLSTNMPDPQQQLHSPNQSLYPQAHMEVSLSSAHPSSIMASQREIESTPRQTSQQSVRSVRPEQLQRRNGNGREILSRTSLSNFRQVQQQLAAHLYYHPEPQMNCYTCQILLDIGNSTALRKRRKRQLKLYFCTSPGCSRRFGSKSDWMSHENSQHWKFESWTCKFGATAANPEGHCGYKGRHLHSFKGHAENRHLGKNKKEEVRAFVKKSRSVNNGFFHDTWCGFCTKRHKQGGSPEERLERRFSHIEDHLLGRNGRSTMVPDQWKPEPGCRVGDGVHAMSAELIPGPSPASCQIAQRRKKPPGKTAKEASSGSTTEVSDDVDTASRPSAKRRATSKSSTNRDSAWKTALPENQMPTATDRPRAAAGEPITIDLTLASPQSHPSTTKEENTNPPPKPSRRRTYQWTCCACGDSGMIWDAGGLCPSCPHQSCQNCTLYKS